MRAVFADCHVGREKGDEGPFLEALVEARRRGATSISLLGDIFHFFIAHPKFETPAIARFLEAVDRLRAAGVPVTYVEGNRDFFLRGSYVESKFREVCDEETFVEGGRRFLLTHGDLLNEEDRPYRFWRAISKNAISRRAIDFLPRRAANRLVWKVEARLYRSNFKHKTRLPVEMIRAFAARRFRDGYDVLLLGHFHRSWSDTVDGGRVEILPAFVDERRWMEVSGDGTTRLVGLSESGPT
jgi:UDP-2,3-diacylglucosamine hydrolase